MTIVFGLVDAVEWPIHPTCRVVRILIEFCGNDTIHNIDSLSAGAFQYDRVISLEWVALDYLVIPKDLPSQAPLHFEPVDFMIFPGHKMGEKLPMHHPSDDGDQRDCLTII